MRKAGWLYKRVLGRSIYHSSVSACQEGARVWRVRRAPTGGGNRTSRILLMFCPGRERWPPGGVGERRKATAARSTNAGLKSQLKEKPAGWVNRYPLAKSRIAEVGGVFFFWHDLVFLLGSAKNIVFVWFCGSGTLTSRGWLACLPVIQ